jgi:hypothetical protein
MLLNENIGIDVVLLEPVIKLLNNVMILNVVEYNEFILAMKKGKGNHKYILTS